MFDRVLQTQFYNLTGLKQFSNIFLHQLTTINN